MSGAGAVRAVEPGVWTCVVCATDEERYLRPFYSVFRACDRCREQRQCWDATPRLAVCVACLDRRESRAANADPRTRVEHRIACTRCQEVKTCMHVCVDKLSPLKAVRAWHPERHSAAIWRTLSWGVFRLGHGYDVARGRTSKGKQWQVGPPAPASEPTRIRSAAAAEPKDITGHRVWTIRRWMRVDAHAFGALVGVRQPTVYRWEAKKKELVKPDPHSARILAMLNRLSEGELSQLGWKMSRRCTHPLFGLFLLLQLEFQEGA